MISIKYGRLVGLVIVGIFAYTATGNPELSLQLTGTTAAVMAVI